ncbi:hypothetical protein OM416_20650 [Paenibacillus sp. LS1]|uniref:hypothetical protein n=1 Tax=Paenibacillus sp. LS1 TaxID=2992120 RepID=UPI00222F02D0|nr:hypothetical protein [Paenibacillus sp. LS1]MCW3794009.1 hypothetical protein [Paenibacillus sp. LS1]
MSGTIGLSLFILHIVDPGGQIKVTYPSFSLGSLIEVTERKVREFYLEPDGYAQIIRIDMNNPETEDRIWSHDFKSEGTLSESIRNIRRYHNAFKGTNEATVRSAIYFALGRNLEACADLVMDTLHSTLKISSESTAFQKS